jgi:hypothetical protein
MVKFSFANWVYILWFLKSVYFLKRKITQLLLYLFISFSLYIFLPMISKSFSRSLSIYFSLSFFISFSLSLSISFYRSFNFAIAKVDALNFFASIFVWVLKIGSWLFSIFSLCIVVNIFLSTSLYIFISIALLCFSEK